MMLKSLTNIPQPIQGVADKREESESGIGQSVRKVDLDAVR